MKSQTSQLIAQYAPLAQAIASKYRTLPHDDRVQEAMLGLIIAALHYDSTKGEFGAYAKRVIRNRLNAMFNREVKQPLPVDFGSVEEADDDDTQKIPKDVLEVEEEHYAVVELMDTFVRLMKCLKEAERVLVRLKILGQTQDECAQELNVSQATVSRMIRKIRQAYNDAIEK